ncbi:O-antigen/teichoic acid export membrane protein [Methylorubrum rhodinum]|uniref:O-antigen/teichoic acid export membrane protein n=1 Tax=Methylorubrum rhodinum TaxID=29428 RepID=A0A840ZN13_9HYPH|nr:polysaccharide biosynthesis C-terminal domain-containing protein [Methylorubrum rhodinum]MBB5759592.1 O-antigen/teichoic acid export membrane protein [Methylorubrum rhodinum]
MAVIAAYVVNAVLNLALGLLLAQILGPADFGRFALGIAGSVVLTTLFFEWLRLSATRFYSERVRGEEPWIRAILDRAYAATALCLVAATLLCLAGRPIAGPPATLAAAAVATAIGIGFFDYQTTLARARFIGGLYLKLVLVKSGLALVLMVGTAWVTGDATAVIAAAGVSQFLAAILIHRSLTDPRHRPDVERGRTMLRVFVTYGLPLIAANVVYQLLPFANRSAIAAVGGFSESGYFSLASDIGTRIFGTLGAALDVLLFQIAVRAEEIGGRQAGERQVARNLAVVAALILPSMAGVWAVLPALEAIVVPDAFRGHFTAYLLPMLPGLVAFAAMNYALNPVFQIRRRTMPVIVAALFGALVNALALLALAGPYGGYGIAVAQTLGFLAAFGLLAGLALTGPDRIALPWRDLAAASAATLLMAAAVWPLRTLAPWLALPACIGTGVLVYGGFVWLFDIAGLRSAVMERRRPALPAAAE